MKDIRELKQKIREEIWRKMEEQNIARFPRPVYGRIPNFVGAEKAAWNLRRTKEWKKSKIIFVNPDSPQRPVRRFALLDSKLLIMASPRIKKGFLVLDPNRIHKYSFGKASTISGAFRYGIITHPSRIPHIDMKVTGCVAVDKKGGRLGKGHGYSDIEWGILSEYGLVDRSTVTATTVHDIQIVESIPMTKNDFPLDIISTPTTVYYTNTAYEKPSGIIWDLVMDRLDEIPLLAELYKNAKMEKIE